MRRMNILSFVLWLLLVGVITTWGFLSIERGFDFIESKVRLDFVRTYIEAAKKCNELRAMYGVGDDEYAQCLGSVKTVQGLKFL